MISTLSGIALVLAALAATGPAAGAQVGIDTEVADAVASFAAASASSGDPVTVVLAGATGPHTLETAGALAAAVGRHGQVAGWQVVGNIADAGTAGPVFVIEDGPGPGAEVEVSTAAGRTTVTMSGDARDVKVLAFALADREVGEPEAVGTDIVVPVTWTHETLADALDLISATAGEGLHAPRVVTDLGADPHRDLVVLGGSSESRMTALAGDDATPTILAYADDQSPALAVSAPLADPDHGFPVLPVVLAAASAALISLAGGFALRRRGEVEPASVTPAC